MSSRTGDTWYVEQILVGIIIYRGRPLLPNTIRFSNLENNCQKGFSVSEYPLAGIGIDIWRMKLNTDTKI